MALVIVLDAWAVHAEAFVKAVRERSGQRVNWHYAGGGRVNVLYLGDRKRVVRAIEEVCHDPELSANVTVLYRQLEPYTVDKESP